MKVIAVQQARGAWVLDFRVLTSGRSLLEPFNAVKDRYRFAKPPQHLMDLSNDGALEFQGGTFKTPRGEDVLVRLGVYNNGLAADTATSTEDSEAFLEDLTSWLKSEHKLPLRDFLLRKFYVSQLDVQSHVSLSLINPNLEGIAKRLTSQALSVDGKPRQFGMAGVSWWTEDAGQREAPVAFRFERKWGTKWSENIYLAYAPLRTQEHIDTLTEIEKILTTH